MVDTRDDSTREMFKQYSKILAEFKDSRHAKLFAGLLSECGEDVAVTGGGKEYPFAVRQAVHE